MNFPAREIQTVLSCLCCRQNEFHRDIVLKETTFAVQKRFSLKEFWCKSTGFNMLFPSPLAKLEQGQGGVRIVALSSVLCTELTLLGRAPVHRGFLPDVTGVLRVPLCAPFLSILQRIETVCILYLTCQYSLVGPMPPTPLALPDTIPVAGSAAEADVRWQSARLLLNTEGERKEAACQSPAGMRRAAGRSCDRAALSQGGFSTPSWVGSQPSCLKPSRWG